MADHEDYQSGETPAAHAETHEDAGSDEMSLAGLDGEPSTLTLHRAIASAHHPKYTDVEAKAAADVQILIHAALATVHQDAPNLILTHKGDASAHHPVYTDAEAKAALFPLAAVLGTL